MSSLQPTWYLDVRAAQTSEHISLDLTRHLPRRLMIGPALIVSDKPDILLPVIRKRWMRVVGEVRKQLASTLDRTKKAELTREVQRMSSLRFSTHIQDPQTDALIISPEQTVCQLPEYRSLYIVDPLTTGQFVSAIEYASPHTTVTVYGDAATYKHTLYALRHNTATYGEGYYPSHCQNLAPSTK